MHVELRGLESLSIWSQSSLDSQAQRSWAGMKLVFTSVNVAKRRDIDAVALAIDTYHNANQSLVVCVWR
jgi:hypothetical protein